MHRSFPELTCPCLADTQDINTISLYPAPRGPTDHLDLSHPGSDESRVRKHSEAAWEGPVISNKQLEGLMLL